MNEDDMTREFWDSIADGWLVQVGTDGDLNRRLNSDPYLWRLLGDVSGQRVLDAGCGVGYLSFKLLDEAGAADVTGVDLAPAMIGLARQRAAERTAAGQRSPDFRVMSCSAMAALADGSFDALVSNYVLMDLPDLSGAVAEFHRVLKPGGRAVVVFSHPCFPLPDLPLPRELAAAQGVVDAADDARCLLMPFSYLTERRTESPPWGHFTKPFIYFHRPLSAYWRAFTAAGFTVADFDEPRLTPDRHHLVPDALKAKIARWSERPYSVIFLLVK